MSMVLNMTHSYTMNVNKKKRDGTISTVHINISDNII